MDETAAMVIREATKDLSILIVSYNTCAVTRKCLAHLQRSRDTLSKEAIVVDNASRDGSADMVAREYPDVTLHVNEENVGFGRANNQALGLVSGRYVLLLNSDAFVGEATLQRSVEFMDDTKDCGILGIRLIGPDGEFQASARSFPTPLKFFLSATGTHHLLPWVKPMDDLDWGFDAIRDCDWVPGSYFLIRREVIDQVGLFDPRYFMYCEEVDLCFAAKARGWRVLFYPGAEVQHIGGQSASAETEVTRAGRQIERLQLESELLYFRKNHGSFTALLDVLLISLADLLSAIRNAAPWRKSSTSRNRLGHIAMVWRVYHQTSFGANPTR